MVDETGCVSTEDEGTSESTQAQQLVEGVQFAYTVPDRTTGASETQVRDCERDGRFVHVLCTGELH